jgi:hypothetical protein
LSNNIWGRGGKNMGLYVIRGKSGMKFESCEVGKVGEETYFSWESANRALKQIESTFPFDVFEIIEQEENK